MAQQNRLLLDDDLVRRFVLALQRLIKVGIYYPSGHKIFQQTMTGLEQVVREVAEEQGDLQLSLAEGRLFLNATEVEAKIPYCRELTTLLANLGIAAVTIARWVEGPALLEFFRTLLARQARLGSIHQFTQLDFGTLPAGITIHRREFLASKSATRMVMQDGASGGLPLASMLNRLRDRGLADHQLAACQGLLESLDPELQVAGGAEGGVEITWEDVEDLLVQIVREELTAGNIGNQKSLSNLDDFSSILQGLERGGQSPKAKEAARLLLSMVKSRPSSVDWEKLAGAGGLRMATQSSVAPVADLEQFVATVAGDRGWADSLVVGREAEEMAIVLHCLGEGMEGVEERLVNLLKDYLSRPLTIDQRRMLHHGMMQFLRPEGVRKIPMLMQQILSSLRLSGNGPAIEFLSGLAKAAAPEVHKYIWPYAVNEILYAGPENAEKRYRALCTWAASCPAGVGSMGMPVLMSLEANKEQKVDLDFGIAVPKQSYPLFAPLLVTPLATLLVARFISYFAASESDWLMDAVSPFLVRDNPRHHRFLQLYLKHPQGEPMTGQLLEAAGEIIAEELQKVPKERRSERYVLQGITALGRLPVESGREFLESIVADKVFLLVPDWPGQCREKARAALAEMKKLMKSRRVK